MEAQGIPSRRATERAAGKAVIDALPPNTARSRVLGLTASAEFIGLSVNTCRRMYAAGTLPRPIKLNTRKYGYQLGTLIDWLEARKKLQAVPA